MEDKKRCWGYRIDTSKITYFKEELEKGVLRQGWGWNEGQNLKNMTFDGGASRNKKMLNVRKDDYLLIPRLPDWNSVTIAIATENWKEGYDFNIEKYGDFGHKFPAKHIVTFNRGSNLVSKTIRTTLRNPARFWEISYLKEDIENIIKNKDNDEINKFKNEEGRLYGSIESACRESFKQDVFRSGLLKEIGNKFQGSEWENALVTGLKELYPEPLFSIERVGGVKEKCHGTDVVIKFTHPLSVLTYIIAIQIKDYEGKVSNDVVNQINKADWWNKNNDEPGETRLLEKIIIITNAQKSENERLEKECKENGITLIMGKELDEIIMQIGLRRISKTFSSMIM